MIMLKVASRTHWDEKNEVFVTTPAAELHLEHSLRAVSKWEAWHGKPFLGRKKWTAGDMLDYIRCMCVDEGVDPTVFLSLSRDQIEAVQKYIELPMTATWFSNSEPEKKSGGSAVTSELIYFWMSSYNIDWQAQDWHLNRLMTLIRVCSEKNKPPKKVPKGVAASRQHSLNTARLKKYGLG